MVSFNTQVCHGEKDYRIQAQFDNYDNFLEAEKKIREIMDRKKDKYDRKTDNIIN